jgi:hypothetical protein
VALIVGLVVLALLLGFLVWRRWLDRPSREVMRINHPTSIHRTGSGSTAVRVLHSHEDVQRAFERARMSAEVVAAARSSRRYRVMTRSPDGE